jgi:gluconate 5-dehydrogenase
MVSRKPVRTSLINGRDGAKVDAVVAQLRAAGARADAAPFDVTDPAAVTEAVKHIESAVGPIDILINNAGIQRRAPLEEFAPETWRELMRVNLDSVFFVSQAVARCMIPRKRGRIVNIGSVVPRDLCEARPTSWHTRSSS